MSKSKIILIHTFSSDEHAKIISYALKQRGHKVICWFGDDIPSHSTITFSFRGSWSRVIFGNISGMNNPDKIDVVWNRRKIPPSLPNDVVDEKDYDFSIMQLRSFTTAFDYYFCNAFWINDIGSMITSELKLLQLKLAQGNGLLIPETIVSNDPVKIRNFLFKLNCCIFKPLKAYCWVENGKRYTTYTANVSADHLPSDALLQAVPGIYQEKIRKKYEVRAQIFGHFYAAIKIVSGELHHGDIDWRIGQGSITHCDNIKLPDKVYASCCSLMRDLNIVSGAFDFIVDEKGCWYFLEVNQQGQFLFMEQWCEQLHLVEAFCQFVERPCSEFEYRYTDTPMKLSCVEKPALACG